MPRPEPRNPWARWALDTLERGARSYASAWVAIYLAGDQILGFWNATFGESLMAAAFATFVSGMFSLAGRRRGAEDSASFLPENTDPPQP
jgi:hypothetical protein